MDEERKHQNFFAITDNEIVETVGYITLEKDAWWCPTLGYTLWYGKHLFDTHKDAKKELIYQIDCLISELEKKKSILI